MQISKSTSILNWETSLVNESKDLGLNRAEIFKKLSSSFSASDFPVKPDGNKLIHSVSSLRIKETSFITFNHVNNNNNGNGSKKGKKKFDHDEVMKKDRPASRIEIWKVYPSEKKFEKDLFVKTSLKNVKSTIVWILQIPDESHKTSFSVFIYLFLIDIKLKQSKTDLLLFWNSQPFFQVNTKYLFINKTWSNWLFISVTFYNQVLRNFTARLALNVSNVCYADKIEWKEAA